MLLPPLLFDGKVVVVTIESLAFSTGDAGLRKGSTVDRDDGAMDAERRVFHPLLSRDA